MVVRLWNLKRLRPCHKNEGQNPFFLFTLSFSLTLQAFRLTNFRTFKLSNSFPVNLATSLGKEFRDFLFGFAAGWLFERLNLIHFLSLQFLLQAFVRCNDRSILSTFNVQISVSTFALAFSF